MKDIKDFNPANHLAIHNALLVSQIIGNGNLIAGLFSEMKPIWGRSYINNTGANKEHMIQDIAYPGETKTQAILDYAMAVMKFFIESKHATLSTHTRRTIQDNKETRKDVLYRIGGNLFTSHQSFFTKLISELYIYDTTLINFALADHPAERNHAFVIALGVLGDDITFEDEWNVVHQELLDLLGEVDISTRRNEITNLLLERAWNGTAGINIIEELIAVLRS